MKSGATESSFYYLSQHYTFPENVDVKRTTHEIIQSNKQYKIIWAHDNCDQAGHRDLPQHIDKIDGIVCVSNWEREQFIKYNRAPAEKLYVIPNGIHEMFQPSGKPKSKTCIFFSAPHKGIKPLVPIWKEVIQHHPDAKLKVFSSMSLYGAIQPGEGENETITTDKGLEPSPFIPVYKELQALPGVEYSPCIDREELLQHIQDAAFYIHPNVWEETFCVSLAEAMACGCFPITTDMGALPETSFGKGKYIPMSGQNTPRGWITDDTFHQNFAEEIIKALHYFDVARDEYDEVSQQISKIAIETYNWERVAEQWKIYIELSIKNNTNKKYSGIQRKVIDSFMFFNEFDILKLRLNYLSEIVDHFIISESNYTHSGKPKPYYLDEILNEIPEEIRKKIIRLKYEPDIKQFNFSTDNEIEKYNNCWKLENENRDLISKNLSSFSSNDFFMVSDVDEIPRREVVEYLSNFELMNDSCYVSSCDMFYYNFKTYSKNYWPGTIFSNVDNIIRNGCSFFRNQRFSLPSIKNGGWHFTYFGGVNKIKEKIESYAHQEYNKERYKDSNGLSNLIENKKHFLNRGEEYGDNFFDYSFDNYPENLRNLIAKFFPQETYIDNKINVCFSTIPSRFSSLDKIIQSFQSQTLKPNKIIITVPTKYHRFSYQKEEIETICSQYQDLVHLLYVNNDYGPATKIYGALKSLELYPNSSVMVCDDDVIYDERLLNCYVKSLETNTECVWTTAKSTEHNGNDLKLLNHNIYKLQGVDTYLFTQNILNKINSNNFEEKYIQFLQKNTDTQSLDDVFLHDDYFVSFLLYDHQIPVKSFYLKHTVYDGIPANNQIHESLKCHSTEVKLIQKIYKNYENQNAVIRCDFTKVDGEKVGEYLVEGELNVEDYNQYIIDIHQKYGSFKIAININPENTMNALLDRKTTDINEYYDWQIRHDKMPDDHIDYLFRLKYWNNFHPKVVYDIGSNYLSWYKLASNVWRDAKIYCVDAFSGFAEVYPNYNIDFAIEVLSDKEETVEFWENPRCPGLCSLYSVNEIHDPGKNFHNQHLNKTLRKTKTLDSLVKEKNWSKPDLIKMDVQGAEVNVLKGAQDTISQCNHLILEVQTQEFSTGAPMLKDVEDYMKSIGFTLFYKIGYNESKCDGDYHFVRSNLLPK